VYDNPKQEVTFLIRDSEEDRRYMAYWAEVSWSGDVTVIHTCPLCGGACPQSPPWFLPYLMAMNSEADIPIEPEVVG
jgi:hypothetical protein